MSLRLAALVVTACLCAAAFAQTPAPNLTRPQRELLQAIVTAVDAAAAQPETDRSEVAAAHPARLGRFALRRVLGRAAGDAVAGRCR